MVSLMLAAIFFVGIHIFISGTRVRDALVGRLGENVYKGLFSLASAVGIVWLGWAYAESGRMLLWAEIPGVRPVSVVLVLIAFLLAVPGLLTPSPTAVGGEARLDRPDTVQGILRITRHPFLWGVALWAAVHLAANGDLASLIMFGALLVLCLAGTLSIDRKRRRALGDSWDAFARATSSVPFAAILAGRNTLKIGEVGWWRLAVALILYAVFLLGHQWLFGVAPMAGY